MEIIEPSKEESEKMKRYSKDLEKTRAQHKNESTHGFLVKNEDKQGTKSTGSNSTLVLIIN